jgi:hypothetical protein
MLALTLLVTLTLGADAPGTPKGDWKPLFNGKDLTGFYTFLQKHGKNNDPDKIITIEDGSIHLYKDAKDGDNVVMGYIGTEQEFGDYHLRFQYRWGEKKFEPRYKMKRDAGLYYHILGADAIWPRALQYQVEQTNVGDLLTLFGFHVDSSIDPKSSTEKMPIFQPIAEGGKSYVMGGKGIAYQRHLAGDHELDGWNTAEIIAKGDTVTHLLNGKVMNQAKNVRLIDPEKGGAARPITKGRIALEIEAAEIFFRNVEIRTLEPTPAQESK